MFTFDLGRKSSGKSEHFFLFAILALVMLNFPGKMLTRIFVTGERLKIRSWEPAPFLKMKKAGILMASHHKNPGRFPNDKFLKTL